MTQDLSFVFIVKIIVFYVLLATITTLRDFCYIGGTKESSSIYTFYNADSFAEEMHKKVSYKK